MAFNNTLSVNQVYTLMNAIVSQATGAQQITPTNTNEFVTVAQVGLKVGYDPLITAISQVLSKTIYSIRPYGAKFKGLMVDSIKYGNHVRKLQVVDKPAEEDERYSLTQGVGVDHYKVNKPEVLQTNFYGQNIFQRHITIYKDQLDTAFSGPQEFGNFITMIMQNVNDQLEQDRESMARMAVSNFIAGKSVCDSDNVVYLLDVYEDETGLTGLDPDTIKQPENFAPFAKWLFAYLRTTSDMMTERSYKFHKNFVIDGTAKNIARHTPLANQKLYLYAKELNNIDTSVISDVFNKEYLQIMDNERVNFWQSINTPMGIEAKPAYNANDGSIAVPAAEPVTLSNVLGVLFDDEAIGVTEIENYSLTTPMNAAGGYSNIYFHSNMRWWNDYTENAVVFILDHKPEVQ